MKPISKELGITCLQKLYNSYFDVNCKGLRQVTLILKKLITVFLKKNVELLKFQSDLFLHQKNL